MKKLSQHPEVKALVKQSQTGVRRTPEQQQNLSGWMKAKQNVESNLERMEYMKPNIKRRYEIYQQYVARRNAEEELNAQQERNAAYNALVGGMDNMSMGSNRSSYGYDRTQQLDPAVSSDLAVKLAHNEFRGADLTGPVTTASSPRRQSAHSSQRRVSQARTFFSDDDSEDDLSQQIMAVGQRREEAFAKRISKDGKLHKQNRSNASNTAPQYPSVPKHSETQPSKWRGSPSPPMSQSQSERLTASPPPARPPKEAIPRSHFSDSPPAVPSKIRTSSPVEAPDTAVLDPRKYTFITSATTEEGRPLRTLFINPKLRSRFLTIALANTQQNLETCGILCGRLVSNAFFVSKLVIPEQEATSDTCDTVNEGALFDYCDSENLMTLGWIHTHPTQTCFMSSRDLHTHSGYQVQLAESIAIVCAPRHEPS
jgi:STAM-binding protein